jgi:hypothetical protein
MKCLRQWKRPNFIKSIWLCLLGSVSIPSKALPHLTFFNLHYLSLFCYLDYLFYLWLLRWPGKKYTYICPPPSPKRTASEIQGAKQAKKSGKNPEEDPEKEDFKGVMYFEYALMIHYLLASLRRADGANSVTSTGIKLFNILAGRGEHR